MTDEDREFMKQSIDQARQSFSEDSRAHPKVGVLVVKDGKVIATAHRGDRDLGGVHAEFAALEVQLKDVAVAGSTVYTTLEPCTTRKHPKVPCAERLIERHVARVVIGMLDPNPDITGRGQRRLREANIATELFPSDLMGEVEELNRSFTRAFARGAALAQVDGEFIKARSRRGLDEWYRMVNSIYWNRNFHLDALAIFGHLVEVIGGLSLLASNKRKPGVSPEEYVCKALAWWLGLCGKVGIKSVEEMLWGKFPGVCTYCQRSVHDNEECGERKRANPGPDWEALSVIGLRNRDARPDTVGKWQRMFATIYPVQQVEEYPATFARLCEELGELAEAVRVFPAVPGYFLSEASDVFAWLMHLQNFIERKNEVLRSDRGLALEASLCRAYPDVCVDCNTIPCNCPPILSSTIGRIAHEVPGKRGGFDELGSFATPDKIMAMFRPEVA